MTFGVEFPQVQYIDLMQIVQVWKAVTIVTSVCLNLSTILVVGHFMSAKVSPEWRLNLGFRTQKKCPFPLNRGVPSIQVTNTRIMWISFRDQILCPLHGYVPWMEGFQCSLSYYKTCCLPIRGLWRKLFSENIFLPTTMATLREVASRRYEEAGVICHYFSGRRVNIGKIKTNIT